MAAKKECCEFAHKKMAFGCLVFLIGFLWYANETVLFGEQFILHHFWPDMAMLVGALFFLKGLLLKLKK